MSNSGETMQEEIYKHKLDLYYLAAIGYVVTFIAYVAIRGSMVGDTFEVVWRDPVVSLLASRTDRCRTCRDTRTTCGDRRKAAFLPLAIQGADLPSGEYRVDRIPSGERADDTRGASLSDSPHQAPEQAPPAPAPSRRL